MSQPPARPLVRLIARAAVRLLTRTVVTGRENVPAQGPLLLVFNHLGHMDAAVLISVLPRNVEAVALSDLYRVPVTGGILRLYGAIPVRRDVFDRAVVTRAQQVLCGGGALMLAPEARMSVSGALEKARGGAAYLALKSQALILPVGLMGTFNRDFYATLKQRRRPRVTVTIGRPFRLHDLPPDAPLHKPELEQASMTIMTHIARLLPAEYRGVYADTAEGEPD